MNVMFKDDKRSYIEEDVKKIQTKPGMYISYLGEQGALHLSKEVVQNAIDECMSKNSPADKIDVELDLDTGILTVEDNGRGVPEDGPNDIPLEILCTKIQSGSKFTRSDNTNTAGENGCGNTAVNALSSVFIWESYRNHKCHQLKFVEGNKESDTYRQTDKDYGCVVKFKPSVKYLGRGAVINKDLLIDWLVKTVYFLPKDTTLKFKVIEGGKKIFSEKYKQRPMSDILKDSTRGKVISLVADWEKSEEVMDIDKGCVTSKNRDLHLDIVFALSPEDHVYVESYCNTILTPDGGVHIDSVKDGLWKFFTREANATLSEREKAKYTVTKNDVLQTLSIVVSLRTAYQVMFVGQTKQAISNNALSPDIRYQTLKAVQEYFSNHKEELTTFIKAFKLNAKARVEANRVRDSIVEKVNNFEKHTMRNYTPCNNTGKMYKELFICEGQSALGVLADGRDADTQAFIAFRGVTANSFKRDVAGILKNNEYRDLTKILKCGIDKNCNIDKLYFNKIIIATDADIDGLNIASGISLFFALYMPQIIEAGKLYRVLPPLYHINNKEHPYVVDKREYIDTYIEDVIKNYKIKFDDISDSKVNKDEFRDFLYDTVEYQSNLERMAKHFGVNMGLIEVVAASLVLYSRANNININKLLGTDRFSTILLAEVQNRYREMSLNENGTALRGVIDGSYQSLDLSERFISKCEDLLPTYAKYGYILYVKDKKGDVYRKMTVMDFLNIADRYKPAIITRYKGLGEMNSSQIWETTLNPNNRRLIQLTFSDVERDMEILKKLHNDSKEDNEARKLMMSKFKINREDLDN